MKKRFCILALLVLVCACVHAETILLRTGARASGEIVFQNDEVVILRDPATGARFQYPRADVSEIITEDSAGEQDEAAEEEQETVIAVNKKVSVQLEVSAGYAYMPHQGGAAASVDLLVGSHHIGNRHLFIGGGLGYHGMFMTGSESYSFLPVQCALRMPLTEQKHAPAFGVALGYGIALSKDYRGGIYTGVDFGYRCRLNEKTALGAVFFAQFQQASLRVQEIIDGEAFVNRTGRSLITFGAKFVLCF